MNNGLKATITVCRNINDIDVQFEDGTAVIHRTYSDFQKGVIFRFKDKPYSILGETKMMNNGMEATIIIFKKYDDIDVLFEDKTIVRHKTYSNFQKGKISNPNYNPYSHIGETRIMNNGLKATIIIYRNYKDNDIKFEDETVVEHKQYFSFQNGNIAHPNLSGNPRRISIFHNFEVKFVAKTKDTAFYKCKCLSCNIEDIMTPQKMIQHERKELEKQNAVIEVEEEIEL